ncbi:TAXI family TRAP transporter solute-binding subunit [Wolinella succinogenes]|uniref:TAXI family TRAP transporter solute-binding subunit n=1 Tax=Wolinella succinogenes TaxID=844 RepID=UPI0024092FB9|nr:TAXI family TRAP transporter solute-binding subunit [Wolinella succinogenes]
MKKSLSLLGLSALLVTSSLQAAEFFTIGTGGVTGTYYPTGGAICRLVNKERKTNNLRCSVESTGGSVYNVNSVMSGELDFGTVQSDVVYNAYNGLDKFEGKPNKELRSVMAIYPELLALVVSKASGITKLEDVKGKKINVGNPGSGNEATGLIVFDAFGIKKSDLAQAGVLTAPECPMALKDKKIDGYFYMVGHPTANITDAANSLPIDIVDIKGDKVDAILQKYPYYAKGIIPQGSYPGVDRDVHSLGVKAVLVGSSKASDKMVEAIVKAILDNFDEFKNLHPAYKSVTKESLLEGLSAPLHPAAEAYYKKVGLLK